MIWVIALIVYNYIIAGMYIYQEKELTVQEVLLCFVPFFFVIMILVVLVVQTKDVVMYMYKKIKKVWK